MQQLLRVTEMDSRCPALISRSFSAPRMHTIRWWMDTTGIRENAKIVQIERRSIDVLMVSSSKLKFNKRNCVCACACVRHIPRARFHFIISAIESARPFVQSIINHTVLVCGLDRAMRAREEREKHIHFHWLLASNYWIIEFFYT